MEQKQPDLSEIERKDDPKRLSPVNIKIVKLRPKEGFTIGICGVMEGQLVMSSIKYKIKRIRPNGTMVLKNMGEFKDE